MTNDRMDVLVPLVTAEERLRTMSDGSLKAAFQCIAVSGRHKSHAPQAEYWWHVLQAIANILSERQMANASAASWSEMKKESGWVKELPSLVHAGRTAAAHHPHLKAI